MYDTTIAAKLLGQLESFLGRISPLFHKLVARFIGDMVDGIIVEKDVKLSSIAMLFADKIVVAIPQFPIRVYRALLDVAVVVDIIAFDSANTVMPLSVTFSVIAGAGLVRLCNESVS